MVDREDFEEAQKLNLETLEIYRVCQVPGS
jgi:hypothetical protein